MQNLTVSVSSQAASAPFRINAEQPNFKLGLFVALTGTPTLTYSVQMTPDDPKNFASVSAWGTNATWYTVTGLSALTANGFAGLEVPCQGIRLNVTAYTQGTATLTICQTN